MFVLEVPLHQKRYKPYDPISRTRIMLMDVTFLSESHIFHPQVMRLTYLFGGSNQVHFSSNNMPWVINNNNNRFNLAPTTVDENHS